MSGMVSLAPYWQEEAFGLLMAGEAGGGGVGLRWSLLSACRQSNNQQVVS